MKTDNDVRNVRHEALTKLAQDLATICKHHGVGVYAEYNPAVGEAVIRVAKIGDNGRWEYNMGFIWSVEPEDVKQPDDCVLYAINEDEGK
jgi:hypothetical protein